MRQKEIKDEINKMELSEKLLLVEDIKNIKKENSNFTIGVQFITSYAINTR